jgi:hypothetical protein
MQCSILKSVSAVMLMISFCSANAKDCGENRDLCGKRTEWNEYETVALQVNQDGMPVPNNFLHAEFP